MADVKLTPIDDIEGGSNRGSNEWDEVVSTIDALPTKAAKFVVTHVEDELAKFKRAFRSAANRNDQTAKFGTDESVDGGTKVQVKLVPKAPGRPTGSANAPKEGEDAAPTVSGSDPAAPTTAA